MSNMQFVPVRAARMADLDAVLRLLVALHGETPHAPLSMARLEEGARECIQDGIAILSLDAEGRPVGTLGLLVQSPWFSEEEWLTDIWMYVHPAHRRTPHARTLLREAKAIAKHNRLPLQMQVTGYGPRIPGKIRLFQRELGAPTGAVFTVRA